MWGADAGRTIKQIVRSGNRVASDRKGKTMKKILTMVVGLLTAIALLAVVAVAQDGGSEAPPQTAAAAEQPAVPGTAPDGDASDDGDEGTAEDADAGAVDDEDEDGWCEPEDGEEMLLAELAAEGVINQDQIPAIISWMKTQGPDLKDYDNPADLLTAAVTDGVITQTQADDIANLINQWKEMEGEEHGSEEDEVNGMLAELAAEGVINQDQIPAIISWMKTQGPDLKDYDNPADLLTAAVTDGVITQTQADDITALIEQMKQMDEADECPTEEDVLNVLLEDLASEGVIDREQIPAIVTWMKTQGPDLDDSDDPADLLTAAVADGVITQTQADDITNLINRMEQAERGSDMSN